MSNEARVPALGAEGWFTYDTDEPHLLGLRCTTCSTSVFPKAGHGCPNPACDGTDLVEVELSRRGTVWSYTDARYQPPPPYVPTAEEYQPFALAAVELDADGIVVLGQVAAGFGVTDLHVGKRVELVVEPLFADDDTEHTIWKWRPVDG